MSHLKLSKESMLRLHLQYYDYEQLPQKSSLEKVTMDRNFKVNHIDLYSTLEHVEILSV